MSHPLAAYLRTVAFGFLASAAVLSAAGVVASMILGDVAAPLSGVPVLAGVLVFVAAFALAEARRVRGPLYWVGVGIVAAVAIAAAAFPELTLAHWILMLATGAIAGLLYWRQAGRQAGRLAARYAAPPSDPLSLL